MTSTPTPTGSAPRFDPRPLLWRAADQIDALLATLGDGEQRQTDLDGLTPCADWTVRDLLAHLVAVEDRIVHIAGGGQPFEVPSSVEGVADDDWLEVWREHRPPIERALADDAVLSRTFHHPAGDMPGARALATYANELTVHGWDVHKALGDRGVTLDEGLAAPLLAPIQHALPAAGREHFPFGDVVEVPDDASAYDRLVAWLGRDPSWSVGLDG